MKIEAKEGVSGQGYHLAELGFGPHSDMSQGPRQDGGGAHGTFCSALSVTTPYPPPAPNKATPLLLPAIQGLQDPFNFRGEEGHKLGPESLEFDLNSPVLDDLGSCLSLLCLCFPLCNKRLWETLHSQNKVEEGMKLPAPGCEHILQPCSGLDPPCAPGGEGGDTPSPLLYARGGGTPGPNLSGAPGGPRAHTQLCAQWPCALPGARPRLCAQRPRALPGPHAAPAPAAARWSEEAGGDAAREDARSGTRNPGTAPRSSPLPCRQGSAPPPGRDSLGGVRVGGGKGGSGVLGEVPPPTRP